MRCQPRDPPKGQPATVDPQYVPIQHSQIEVTRANAFVSSDVDTGSKATLGSDQGIVSGPDRHAFLPRATGLHPSTKFVPERSEDIDTEDSWGGKGNDLEALAMNTTMI
jgi:hypothetical protein